MDENINKKQFISNWISHILGAPFLAIPVFLIINLSFQLENFLIIEIICLLFATIIPVVLVYIGSKVKKVDVDYTAKEERNSILLIATAVYFLGLIFLYIFSANPFTIALMLCYGTNTFIVFLINLKWKISIHAMGIAGPTTALLFISPWFFIFGLLGPLVIWARLTLKKHTIWQVLIGSAFGYFLTTIQLYYLMVLMDFNINLNVYYILLIIICLNIANFILFYKKPKKNIS